MDTATRRGPDGDRGYAVVSPGDHLDHYTTPGFREALREAAGSGPVIVDLTGVSFADSEGIGALAGAVHRSMESGDRVVVACRRPSLLRVLSMSRIDTAVAVVPSLEEAASLVRAGRRSEEGGHEVR
ncbi:MAG TPA: STAS domain-containing protein [Acidimicrobiales bacterium]|nr:STAS domain-containing protein [Acidimicrobiales bacterium]